MPVVSHSVSVPNVSVAHGSDDEVAELLIGLFVDCSDAVQSCLVIPIALLRRVKGSLEPPLLISYNLQNIGIVNDGYIFECSMKETNYSA